MRRLLPIALLATACSSGRATDPVGSARPAEASASATASPTASLSGAVSSSKGRPVVAHLFLGAAADHACFVSERGGLFCWGRSDAGQLGGGDPGPSRPVPAQVKLPGAVRSAALGERHTCALLVDGSVHCWGTDAAGARRIEDAVTGLSDVTSLVAGGDFTCALSRDRSVRCWGRVPGRPEIAPNARLVEGLAAVEIAASSATLCALTPDGTTTCLGQNAGGKIAIGAATTLEAPTPVPYVAGASRIAASDLGLCGVVGDRAQCFGDRASSPSLTLYSVRDVIASADGLVCGLRDDDFSCERLPFGGWLSWRSDVPVREIGVGRGFVCAVTQKTGGAIACWGVNDWAELGVPAPKARPAPEELVPLAGATRIAAGTASVCALTRDKKIRCLGDNGKSSQSWSPNGATDTPLGDDAASSITRADDLSVGGDIRCAFTDGLPTCWGDNRSNQIASVNPGLIEVPSTFASLGKLTRLVFGPTHACSLAEDGKVRCWGGAGKERTTPTEIAGLVSAHDIAVGRDRACALADDGTVSCFGLRGEHAREPRKIVGAKGFTSIAAGGRHFCGVTATRQVSCFGANDLGQLARPLDDGDGERAAIVPKLEHVKEVTLGETFTCALSDDGTVRCFGAANEGELGRDDRSPSAEPVAVAGLHDAVQIAASAHAVSARLRDGRVLAWGGRAFFARVSDALDHSDSPRTIPTESLTEESP